ncbi:hypothetical protein PVNG_04491 [Plasmodium vivax North Korean]|uniref:Variable surface protein Vir35 n=1 Tax=Plasmodium vivax North Korean TaxID=1035514 RepID=A0A0J9U2M9_PLAVI|nr:hypothetical protein PVNG_04491 [Plasmodium vivax North Korean]
MEALKNFNFKENIKFSFFLKTFTFILLIWVYYPQKDMFLFRKTLKKRHNSYETVHVIFNRLLTKNEMQKKLYHDSTKDYTPYDIGNKKDKNNIHTKSTYSHSKSRKFDHLDNYKKNYGSRHSKKKGLAKLDSYYEKKIFDKIDYMYEHAEKSQIAKKSIINKKLSKYVIKFLLFALLPFLGLIYPILCGADKEGKAIIPLSTDSFIKYEGLKAGKGKMNKKEYFNICKNVFMN